MSKTKNTIKTILAFILLFMVVYVSSNLLKFYCYEKIMVEGLSMEPNIESGAIVTIHKSNYKLERGDYIVYFRLLDETDELDENIVAKPTLSDILFGNSLFGNGGSSSFDHNKYRMVIKRVIAVGGDKIEIKDCEVYINDEKLDEGYIYEAMYPKRDDHTGVSNQVWELESDELFAMGDNRNISEDCEDYGPIKTSQILGKVFIIQQSGNLEYVG